MTPQEKERLACWGCILGGLVVAIGGFKLAMVMPHKEGEFGLHSLVALGAVLIGCRLGLMGMGVVVGKGGRTYTLHCPHCFVDLHGKSIPMKLDDGTYKCVVCGKAFK